MRTLKPRKGKAKHSVLAVISRAYPLPRFFDSIAASDIPFAECRFIAYVDSDDASLIDTVKSRALAIPFSAVTLCVAGNTDSAVDIVGLVPKATDKLLLLDTNTIIPTNAWALLLNPADNVAPRGILTDRRAKPLKHKALVMGKDVIMDGVSYPKGQRVSLETARRMSELGLITADLT